MRFVPCVIRILIVASCLVMETIARAQSGPAVIDTNLQMRLVLQTPLDSSSVRIRKDPRNNQLYYLKLSGDVYQVNLTNSTSTKVYSTADHGLYGAVEGMAIGPDGTMYLLGDFLTNNNYNGFVRIMKGVPDANGMRVWSLLAQTDLWPRGMGLYDHNCSALLVSADGQTLYVNAGARTDHGEVEDAGGVFPNTRDVPLTAGIFQLPTSGTNLFLTNDYTALLQAGYVYCRGTRNAFALAYAPNGDLFATENGPDRDMPDSILWLRQGLHFGFPWRMGGMDNPQQFPTYNPANDLLLNNLFYAASAGLYANDPAFPPPPTNFTDPVINLGPEANEYRDPADGVIKNAAHTGYTLASLTPHRSPLGLVFDTTGSMAPPYQNHGFMLSWTAGDPSGDSISGPFDDPGEDMVDLNLSKLGQTNYEANITRIVGGFANPIDAEIIGNKVYVIEYGGNQGLWEITFPPAKPRILSVSLVSGAPVLNLAGIPGNCYKIQRTTNLTATAWTDISTTNAPSNGVFQYSDTFGDLGATLTAAWYRLRSP